MSLLRRAAGLGGTESVLTSDGRLIGRRAAGTRRVSSDMALRSSAVWACLRLRADLVSTLPFDVYRRVGGVDVTVDAKPPILVQPGGERVDIIEHLYSSQFDLDRVGNTFGLITEVDALGLPRRIDLEPAENVTVQIRKGELRYKFGNKVYEPSQVWHEKQYTTSGLPVGLSPISYAALTLNNYLSAAEFASDWFANGSVPAGRLKNTRRVVPPDEARAIKARFKESVSARDIFVHGADWDYSFISVSANESQFLETIQASKLEVCQFLGVPGDMIDVPVNGASITYANVTQRNLQLLIVNLGPALRRRETALSRLLPKPRFAKFKTEEILRMDPATREQMLGNMVSQWKTLAPSEARALSNRPPFTPEQIAEMKELGIITKGTTTKPIAGQPENGATT